MSYHAQAIKQREAVAWTVRDHDAQDGAELNALGIATKPAQKDVAAGIQKVAERIKMQPDGKPRLIVFRDKCPETAREMGKYQWLKKKAA